MYGHFGGAFSSAKMLPLPRNVAWYLFVILRSCGFIPTRDLLTCTKIKKPWETEQSPVSWVRVPKCSINTENNKKNLAFYKDKKCFI